MNLDLILDLEDIENRNKRHLTKKQRNAIRASARARYKRMSPEKKEARNKGIREARAKMNPAIKRLKDRIRRTKRKAKDPDAFRAYFRVKAAEFRERHIEKIRAKGREKHRADRQGKPDTRLTAVMTDENDWFPSIVEAAKKYRCSTRAITVALNNPKATCRGLRWKRAGTPDPVEWSEPKRLLGRSKAYVESR